MDFGRCCQAFPRRCQHHLAAVEGYEATSFVDRPLLRRRERQTGLERDVAIEAILVLSKDQERLRTLDSPDSDVARYQLQREGLGLHL